MGRQYHHAKFTPEQIEILAANPFTNKVDFHHIWFTLEFQNLFLTRYENGETSSEIFAGLGYDIAILGENRVYGYPRRLMKRIESGQGLTETAGNHKVSEPQNVDYNTMPSQQSVASMQRELTYLRQQVEFLKKISELGNDKKPRT
jgi:hypothetical protein